MKDPSDSRKFSGRGPCFRLTCPEKLSIIFSMRIYEMHGMLRRIWETLPYINPCGIWDTVINKATLAGELAVPYTCNPLQQGTIPVLRLELVGSGIGKER